MSTAREIILEVKRKLGNVNAAVPDETDILAHLNSALRGIWNYAIEIDSPRLETTENYICDTTGDITLSFKPVKMSSVINMTRHRIVERYAPRGAALLRVTAYASGVMGYQETLTGIHLIYTGTYTGGDTIRVTYYPEYTPLADRDSDLPFASSINNVVIAWTVRQILEGQNAMTADMANAMQVPSNSLVQYFEGHADEHYLGNGPW